jgi:WD40 repeat protein
MSTALAKRLATLDQKQWGAVLKGLDASSKKKLEQAVNKVDKSKPPKKVTSGGNGTGTKSKTGNKDNPLYATDQSRRGKYRFGKGTIQYYNPSEGYPSKEEQSREVEGSLELQHAYGFDGTSRQNLIYRDGKLIYFLAAVGIVHNLEDGTQKFFTDHNDDVTTVCADPRDGSKMVATAQKDPKDTPGQGKDLPKVYVWNYETMETVCLIDKVCPQTIIRVQWSKVSGYLYVICGDKNQTLKIYDTSELTGGKADKKTKRKSSNCIIRCTINK